MRVIGAMVVIVVCVIIVTMIVMIIMGMIMIVVTMVIMAVIIVMCVVVIMVIIMGVIVMIVAVVAIMIMAMVVIVRMIIMVVVIIVAVFTDFDDINTGAGCDDRGLCVAGFDQPLKKAFKTKTIGDHKVCAGYGNHVCGDRLIDVSVLTRTDYAGDRNMITAYRAGHIRED
jgi:hypothetical protein